MVELLPKDTKIDLYDHGGARVYVEKPSGGRDLIMDLYACDGEDPAARRDAILTALATPAIPATQEAVERVAIAIFADQQGYAAFQAQSVWPYVNPGARDRYLRYARAALAASGHGPAEGFVMVPVEPTEAMLAAAGYADATEEGKDYIRMRYRLMIAAAGRPE